MTLPVIGNSRQHQIMTSQVSMGLSRKKRAWQRIVRAKINNQARVLSMVGEEDVQLKRLSQKVTSGDQTNCEAQAAQVYWRKLFGSKFRRRGGSKGVNSALNYAYAIVRSCSARAVVAAGLHPTLSIHHKNPRNAFNLVDDLMEPFRPIADYLVWQIDVCGVESLDPEIKMKLASILNLKIPLLKENQIYSETPLSLALVKSAKSFADYCQHSEKYFLLPALPKLIEFLKS